MLLIETYIDKSTIPNAGMGCFAAKDIKQGEKIWELNSNIDRIYTSKNIAEMTPIEQKFVCTYAYKHAGLYFLCIDNARFFNHSKSPNTYDPMDEICTYAAKDILKDEEILSDYESFGCTEDDNKFNLTL